MKNKKRICEQRVVRKFVKYIRRKREIKRRKKKGYLFSKKKQLKVNYIIKDVVKSPENLIFVQNFVGCTYFFNQLRLKENCSFVKNEKFYRIDLSKLKDIDFASVSILKSIIEEAKYYGINFKSNLPKDQDCRQTLIEYGFLNNFYDKHNKKINIKSQGNCFSYEKKSGMLTVKDLESFQDISDKVYSDLTGENGYCDDICSILKEIGGNAVEWSNSYNQQWLIGYYQDKDRIIINVIDLGRGILNSLFRESRLKLIDFFLVHDKSDILRRAFDRKYGSLSQEINRNRGLPFIKKAFEENKIENLKVCTNEVFMDFNDSNKTILSNEKVSFEGTFYQWEVTINCLDK